MSTTSAGDRRRSRRSRGRFTRSVSGSGSAFTRSTSPARRTLSRTSCLACGTAHTIDRVASQLTHQGDRYNSYWPDPGAEAVDAFAQTWRGENNWVNPPFRLVNRVLDLVESQGVEATIIAPIWQTAPWFLRLAEMSIDLPILFPCARDSFLPGSRGNTEPMNNPPWRFAAWRVSGARQHRVGRAKAVTSLRAQLLRGTRGARTRGHAASSPTARPKVYRPYQQPQRS